MPGEPRPGRLGRLEHLLSDFQTWGPRFVTTRSCRAHPAHNRTGSQTEGGSAGGGQRGDAGVAPVPRGFPGDPHCHAEPTRRILSIGSMGAAGPTERPQRPVPTLLETVTPCLCFSPSGPKGLSRVFHVLVTCLFPFSSPQTLEKPVRSANSPWCGHARSGPPGHRAAGVLAQLTPQAVHCCALSLGIQLADTGGRLPGRLRCEKPSAQSPSHSSQAQLEN